MSSAGWLFGSNVTEDIFAVLRGDGVFSGNDARGPFSLFPLDSSVPVRASYWLFEASETSLGAITCSAAGSLRLNDDELLLDLQKAATVSCPGQPVAGSVNTCMGDDCPPGSGTGSILGKPWTATGSAGYSFGGAGRGHVRFEDGSLLVVSREPDFDATPKAVRWGLLFTAPDSAFQGQVFCVGSGSSQDTATFATKWQLGGFSLLPACPASAAGTLTGCLR